MIAAFVAASAMLVSCESDTDPPTITVNLNGTNQNTISVAANQTVTMNIDWEADEGTRLSDIRLSEVGGTNVEGFPVTRGFAPTNNLHRLTGFVVGSPHPTDGGVVTYRTEVTDNNNNSRNVDIVITFTAITIAQPPAAGTDDTPLGRAETITLARPAEAGFAAENATIGIRWIQNPTNTTAQFGPTSGAQLRRITKAVHDAITTREALVSTFNNLQATTTVNVGPAGNNFTQEYFITRVGADNYFLVHMTGLTFNAGSNRAIFSYQAAQ